MELHPEFDVETETWFVPATEYEAKTLSDLQSIVGKCIKLAGYYPLGFGLIQQEGFAPLSKYVKARPPNPAQWREHGKRSLPPTPIDIKSKPDVESIIEDWAGAVPINNIASKHGISTRYVNYLISAARRQGDLRAKPRTSSVTLSLAPMGRHSKADLELIQGYIVEGLSYSQIGKRLHISRSAVASIVRRNKISP